MLAANFRYGLIISLATYFNQLAAYEKIIINEQSIRAVIVDPKKTTLHWMNAEEKPYRYLNVLQKSLKKQGIIPNIMMNAGIYNKQYQPAGLHIEKGKIITPLNTNKGYGNFHLQPNGVFLITHTGKPNIVTTHTYQKYYQQQTSLVRLATQSGPMLLINGKINPIFIKNSTSRYIRNAVCTTAKDRLYFIASDSKVNFYTFAQANKKLGCHNALYLDGSISKLYLKNHNTTFQFRPFVGILSVKN